MGKVDGVGVRLMEHQGFVVNSSTGAVQNLQRYQSHLKNWV